MWPVNIEDSRLYHSLFLPESAKEVTIPDFNLVDKMTNINYLIAVPG